MPKSYEWYRVFCTAARLGSITAAAEALYLSQPAVSQTIKNLESSLGCMLFYRGPKGISLTAEGKALWQHVEKGVRQIEWGEERLKRRLQMESGEVYIGASDMTLEYFLLPFLEAFHRDYPAVRLSITNGPTPETLGKLSEGKIDFGAVSTPLKDIGDACQVVAVKEIEDVFITADITLAKKCLAFAEIARQPLILLEENTSTRQALNAFFASEGVSLRPEFVLATSNLIVQFAQKGLGVGCVVLDIARQALQNGLVYRVPTKRPLPKRQICLVRKREPLSHAAEKLFAALIP